MMWARLLKSLNSLWGYRILKVNELLDEYQVTLYLFPETMWERRGFYFPDERIIYVNGDLPLEEREDVILHELGHINHNPAHYKRLLYKYENEADRFMIRHLISEELAQYEVSDFNWLQFAERHKISTTWGEQMIQEEFKNVVGI
nr:MAG TPA: IrrE protein [Caudoviricetes sp.]